MPTDVDKLDLSRTRARIETTHGTMTLEFFPAKAPNTVKSFAKLATKGFYDGLVFHRVVKGFMIQGGCPRGDGTGDAGFKLKAEFNDTPHVRGVLSMARAQDPDSAGCQFFICDGEATFLDRKYTAFGRIVPNDAASFQTLSKIASVDVAPSAGGERSKPRERVGIQRVVIDEAAA